MSPISQPVARKSPERSQAFHRYARSGPRCKVWSKVRSVALLLSLASGTCASAQNAGSSAMGMPAGDRIENGKRVFVAQGCNNCHGTNGQGGSAAGMAGPRLSPPPQSLSAFVTQVREPRGEMPPYNVAKVSNADIEDVYTFLKSNQSNSTNSSSAGTPATGNPQHGKVLYADYGCYSCHGRHAEGSTATGPRLNPSPVPLETFIRYLRHPTGDMPPYTGKVASDADLANVFAFLQTLPAPPSLQSIPLLK